MCLQTQPLLKGFAYYLDDFYELVHAWVSGENWLSEHKLREHATRTPDIDIGRVVCKKTSTMSGLFFVRFKGNPIVR